MGRIKPTDFHFLREVEISPKETLKCRYFYFMWLLMFCNIIPITLLTSTYKVGGKSRKKKEFF